ncbi:hypothetical protein M422DRAFT_265386 [Sphaerobolus stellatus SS14]|uniref:Uncharacterized protein n=1 Tax=Sphaerobolus stellatus (strain SS14) TaxID=990650 RepID=A0A0C9UDG1_SPHS4|nr:hypothetical protein M422DRAFT_265386 [Sphaerobolus stellatus SS14]
MQSTFPQLSRILSSPSSSWSPPSSPSDAIAARRAKLRAHEEDVRMEYFAPYLKEIDDAYDEGIILTWFRGSKQSEPWGWPSDEVGVPFKIYDIPHPTCPCESQGTEEGPCKARIWVVSSLGSVYRGEVAIGCERRTCGFWKSLSEVCKHPDLITVQYKKRASPGPGLNNFDPKRVLDRTNKDPIPITPPTPFNKKAVKRSAGFAGISKQKKPSPVTSKVTKLSKVVEKTLSDPASQSLRPLTVFSATTQFPPPNQLALLPESSKAPISTPSSTYSYDNFRSLNSTPTSTVSLETYYALQGEYLRLKEQHHKVQNDLTILKIQYNLEQDRVKMQTKEVSKRPSDRFWGETSCLYFLPDAKDICKLNRDASPLYGPILTQTLSALFSPNGISKEELWSAIDICNCDRVFGKGYLYAFHAPTCLDWPKSVAHGSSPSSPSTSSTSSPSSTSVVEGLLTPKDNISMTELERKRDDGAAGNFPKGWEFDIEHLWSHVIGKASSDS